MRQETDPMRRELSRRTFLQTGAAVGGGLLLGFTLPPLSPLPPRVRNDGPFAPNAFIRIDRDGRVTLMMHKVEMGQGTYTSMPMLLAEELEVELSQVRLEHAPPNDALYAEPLFGVQETGGSTSVRGNWEPLRRAGAGARALLVAAAAQTWNVDTSSCHATGGVVIHGPTGRTLAYGALVDRKSTRLNSSHLVISYAVFCLKKKNHTNPLPHARHAGYHQPLNDDPQHCAQRRHHAPGLGVRTLVSAHKTQPCRATSDRRAAR